MYSERDNRTVYVTGDEEISDILIVITKVDSNSLNDTFKAVLH